MSDDDDDFVLEEEGEKNRKRPRSPTKAGKQAKVASVAKHGKQSKKLSQQLFTAVKRAVKKQGHTQQKKPWAEPISVVWPADVWHELLGDCPSTSESKAMIKKVVPASYAVERLGWDKAIHPVKYTGGTWAPIGSHPHIYAIAAYDTIELRYKPSTGLVTCKVRTFLAGTGSSDVEERIALMQYE